MRRAEQISSLALILAAGLAVSPAYAASTTVTAADANVLNLLSPFLSLNATTISQAALTANLNGTIATNQAAAASPVIKAVSISDKTIFSSNSSLTSISTVLNGTQFYGAGANLGGGLPTRRSRTASLTAATAI